MNCGHKQTDVIVMDFAKIYTNLTFAGLDRDLHTKWIDSKLRKNFSSLTGIEPDFPACLANTLPHSYKSRLVPQGSARVTYLYPVAC